MLDNYPPDMSWEDWEHLEGAYYCERCGKKFYENEHCVDDHIYCDGCYEEIMEEQEDGED